MDMVTADMRIKNKAQDTSTEQSMEDSQDEHDVKALSDTELREQLRSYGISPGPILPSTRAVYEKKLLRLMKICPKVASTKKTGVGESEKDGEKAGAGEVVFESDDLKETTESTSELDDKPPVDMADRQKKLLSPDIEYSLAKIVAELQEILPEGKGAAHRFQGQRRKFDSSPERNPGQKITKTPCEDYDQPDDDVTEGTSTRRRAATLNPASGQHDAEIQQEMMPETAKKGLLSRRAKIALFAIFVFVFFLFIM